jgi:exopolysaccharide biosynthesis predicted pyruvyltransferase EpsI
VCKKEESVLLSDIDAEYLRGLRASAELALRGAIGEAVDVALLDAPNQVNVGDSLIWAGEMAYLRRMGLRVRYMADQKSYDPAALRRAMPSGVVLLQGGGNFGDLWTGHQNHRERIAQDLPDYRLVQLPQSVQFQSEERAAQANAILGAHPDFHLLLRDTQSMARAAKLLPSLKQVFCSDMALGYDPPAGTRSSSDGSLLIIARQDKEALSGLYAVGENWIPGIKTRITDWHREGWVAVRFNLARRAIRIHHRLVRYHRRLSVIPTFPQWAVRRLVASLNYTNISGALGMYSSAGLVVVDRLHAHVLAILLGIDHVVLDNNYHKIKAVFDEYTGKFTTARYATDIEVARGYVEDLAAS